MDKKLIFVYNANSGKWRALLDLAHKILNPGTYSCKLCALAHTPVGENKNWKNFRKSSNIEMEFYHKDEFLDIFASKYLLKFEFPVVLFTENTELQVFISAEELEQVKSVEELIEIVKNRE